MGVAKPLWPYAVGTFYKMAAGVHTLAFVEQHPSVGTLPSADKHYYVVTLGEGCNGSHAVGHLPADGVEALEMCLGRHVAADIVDYPMILVEAFCCLRIEVYVAGEVEARSLFVAFYDDGMMVGLPHEPHHFGVSVLAEDDDLCIWVTLILALYPPLKPEHHRACGVNNFNIIPMGALVGLRWFAMGSEEHFCGVQLRELVVVDGDEPFLVQTFHFDTVVHDVAQTIQAARGCELLLGFLYCRGNAKAEPAAAVYFYC